MSLDLLAKLWADGATLTEIERATGVSRGAVAGHIARARKTGDPRFPPRPVKPEPKLRRVDEVLRNRMPPPGRRRLRRVVFDRVGPRRNAVRPGTTSATAGRRAAGRGSKRPPSSRKGADADRMRARRPPTAGLEGFCRMPGRMDPSDTETAVLRTATSAGLSADGVSTHLLFPRSATVLCSAWRG